MKRGLDDDENKDLHSVAFYRKKPYQKGEAATYPAWLLLPR